MVHRPRPKSTVGRHWFAVTLVSAVIACLMLPGVAQAHGPIAPIASSYLARITDVPAGIDAKVVDGDLRMWMAVPSSKTVVVLDYQGAPYLRFTISGVAVNHNSAMYYLNQTPFAQSPPTNLNRSTPPNWQSASGGHHYEWHDGRLHALAAVALTPGRSYVGRWTIPMLIDGRVTAISGGLWHADDPPIVWFWPIAVIVLCVLAGWRVRRPRLDARLARVLAVVALSGVTTAGFGLQLHGRPAVSIFQLLELAAILAFVGWASVRVLFQRPGYFTFFLIAIAALWAGGELVPTLLNGYALIAIPAFAARTASVVCLGTGIGLLLLVFRLADHPEAGRARKRSSATRESANGHLSHAPGVRT